MSITESVRGDEEGFGAQGLQRSNMDFLGRMLLPSFCPSFKTCIRLLPGQRRLQPRLELGYSGILILLDIFCVDISWNQLLGCPRKLVNG